jgi:hypothetical protein
MTEQSALLDEATFIFSQDGNCLDGPDQSEFLEIKAQSSLGIDYDKECFFTLSTEKWSVDSAKDLEELFTRIKQVIKKL